MIPLTTLESYASQVSGTSVVISCEADATFTAGDDGIAFVGADGSILNVVHIRQSLCTDAQNLDRKRIRDGVAYLTYAGQRVDQTGDALEVILHEAMHVGLQSGDEAVVECTAYQNRWAFVRQFRLVAWVANAVMAGMAWHHAQMPAQYHAAGGC